MIARIRRFFDRVRGTERLIFLLILAYDLYLYVQMIREGYVALVFLFMSVGIATGVTTAACLINYPKVMIRIITLSGYSIMAVVLLTRVANFALPFWGVLLVHPLVWFWFSSQFWFVSRPRMTLLDREHHPEWFADDDDPSASSTEDTRSI